MAIIQFAQLDIGIQTEDQLQGGMQQALRMDVSGSFL